MISVQVATLKQHTQIAQIYYCYKLLSLYVRAQWTWNLLHNGCTGIEHIMYKITSAILVRYCFLWTHSYWIPHLFSSCTAFFVTSSSSFFYFLSFQFYRFSLTPMPCTPWVRCIYCDRRTAEKKIANNNYISRMKPSIESWVVCEPKVNTNMKTNERLMHFYIFSLLLFTVNRFVK